MGTFKLKILCQRTEKGKFVEYDEGAHFLSVYNATGGVPATATAMKDD